MLLTKDYEGLTLVIATKGICNTRRVPETRFVEVQAGENWHEFVFGV
jgi:hypothetical protein